jgi:flagellar hook assembly protein FlgD
VEIYNIKGQLIQSLKNAVNDNGYYSVLWNGMDSYNKPVSSGIYFYKLIADGKEMSYKKMAVLK